MVALVLSLLLITGCRHSSSGGGGVSPPPLDGGSLSYAEEASGAETDVVRLMTPKVTNATERTVEIILVVTDLANLDLVGIGFDLKLESSIGARFNGFKPSDASGLLAHASVYSDSAGVPSPQHIVVGLSCKGRAERLKSKEQDGVIEIGTLSIKVDQPGEVKITLLLSQAPGASSPKSGAGMVSEGGTVLLQVQGPSLRGGLLVLPAATG